MTREAPLGVALQQNDSPTRRNAQPDDGPSLRARPSHHAQRSRQSQGTRGTFGMHRATYGPCSTALAIDGLVYGRADRPGRPAILVDDRLHQLTDQNS